MPAMGSSIAEGTIVGWSKSIGDAVAVDETLCEISTDKIETECPSPVAGILIEILAQVDETVEVGTVIARIASGAGAVDAPGAAGSRPAGMVSPASAAGPAASARPAVAGQDARTIRHSPVVRRMAAAHQVDLSRVTGTGRNGRITKLDLLAHLAAGEPDDERPLHSESPYRPDPPQPVAGDVSPRAPTAGDEIGGAPATLSRMRQSIGAAMLRSQATAATCHTIVECDMSRVRVRRRELGITALPLVARAVIDTVPDFPELNATLNDTTIVRFDRVHLGIAVSLGAEGLIVPVIRDAQELSPEGLAARVRDLAARARDRRLEPSEVQGATFTITNPGASGSIIATPIINLPQVAILDLEAIVRRPVVVVDEDGNEAIAIRPMVNLILGWDHRALDGVYAAEFLTALRRRLEAV